MTSSPVAASRDRIHRSKSVASLSRSTRYCEWKWWTAHSVVMKRRDPSPTASSENR